MCRVCHLFSHIILLEGVLCHSFNKAIYLLFIYALIHEGTNGMINVSSYNFLGGMFLTSLCQLRFDSFGVQSYELNVAFAWCVFAGSCKPIPDCLQVNFFIFACKAVNYFLKSYPSVFFWNKGRINKSASKS